MAETRKPKTAAPKRKAAKEATTAKTSKLKSAAKASTVSKKKRPAAKPRRPAAKRPASKSSSSGFDIAKLIDHPLVADLLTVGAMAAVAAIADHNVKTRTGEAAPGSSKAVRAAGKAAAAAVGKRLMTEVDQLRKTAKPKA